MHADGYLVAGRGDYETGKIYTLKATTYLDKVRYYSGFDARCTYWRGIGPSYKDAEYKFEYVGGDLIMGDDISLHFASKQASIIHHAVTFELPDYITNEDRYISVLYFHIPDELFKRSPTTNIIINDGFHIIGRSAFQDCQKLTDIKLPPSLTYIGDYAFKGCIALPSISLPSGTNYGEGIFEDCINLSDVTFSGLGKAMFKGCSGLKSITIPEVSSIPESAFEGCKSLSSITIPNSVESIEDFAFEGCSSLKEVRFGDSIVKIGKGAFKGCTALTSITIPESVEHIDDSTFEGCSSLKEVKIGDSVVKIGKGAFKGCSALTSFTIPNSVENIDDSAFEGCTEFTSVEIPNSVTYIGTEAFKDCSDLNSVIISPNIASFGENIWKGCEKIKDIYYLSTQPVIASMSVFDDTNYEDAELHVDESIQKRISSMMPWRAFENINGTIEPRYTLTYKFTGSEATLTGFNSDRVVNLVIPAETKINGKNFTVTEISDKALKGSAMFKSLYIPETITTIAPDAFNDCSNLLKIDYNAKALDDVPPSLFSKCVNLKVINICDDVAEIPANLFNSTTAEIINISDNVLTIGVNAFYNSGKIKEITLGKGIETIEADAFSLPSEKDPVHRNINFNPISMKNYSDAFANCAIDTIRFGEDVEKCPKYTLRDCKPSVIESYNPEPPSMSDYCLESANKFSCKLLVPVGSKTAYSYAYIWRQFNKINDDLSGIEDVTVDAVIDELTPVTVYSLTGQKVYSGILSEMTLKPGIYIISQGCKRTKIAIR